MVLNAYNTMVEATNDLRQRGFTAQFELQDGQLYNTESKALYDPSELQIVEYHRFEGMTKPADDAIIFAVESCEGDNQGTIVMNYPSNGDMDLYSFMDKVRIKPSDD